MLEQCKHSMVTHDEEDAEPLEGLIKVQLRRVSLIETGEVSFHNILKSLDIFISRTFK